MGPDHTSFLQHVMREFGTVPPLGLACAAAAGAATIAEDLVFWHSDPLPKTILYSIVATIALGWIFASYVATMTMIERPCSLAGGARYLAAFVALMAIALLPLWLVFQLLDTSTGAGFGIMMFMVLAGIVILLATSTVAAMLVAWPIAQALSQRLIGWRAVLNAMQGIRWPLIASMVVTSGLDRTVPDTATADSPTGAIALAAMNGIVDAILLLVFASIAVAAWKRGVERDALLDGHHFTE